MDTRPVGIFDSGFGGLTVLRAINDLMPNERLVYFGDSARYPYGPKTREQVSAYSLQIAELLIERYDIKMLVVACNTASAQALPMLEERFAIPVVGMIEPGARALAMQSMGERIGVIGTVGTIGSGAYQTRLARIAPKKRLVCAATPGFVEFVERGETDSDQLKVLAERLLRPVIDAKVQTLLLGCTHYPFLARAISEVLGPETVLVSSSEETAFEVRGELLQAALATEAGEPADIVYMTSGDPDEFRRIGRCLLGIDLRDVVSVKWAGE
ncbi:MAG: glutamate racemase [Nitrospiraceae bacterium]|nr:glutamate racemase [Nitrospiraceae bacterium]